jgi:hypothetical protein
MRKIINSIYVIRWDGAPSCRQSFWATTST